MPVPYFGLGFGLGSDIYVSHVKAWGLGWEAIYLPNPKTKRITIAANFGFFREKKMKTWAPCVLEERMPISLGRSMSLGTVRDI